MGSKDSITSKQVYTNKKTIKINAPKYADTITTEVKKHTSVFYEEFMNSGEIEFDAHTPLGKSPSGKPMGKIEMIGQNIINEDPTAAPVVRMIIRSSIPFDALPDSNNFIYRHTLKLKNEDEWDADDLVIGCEVDNKDATRHGVIQFKKDFNLKDVAKTLKNAAADLVDPKDKIVKADLDKKLYVSKKVKKGSVDYVETQCTISIVFDERVKKFAGKIFDKFYQATVGL